METTERVLFDDLAHLGARFEDDEFCLELYRALAGGHLTKDGEAVAPSWKRAEDLINELRGLRGKDGLTLAQTGHEGQLSDDARAALDEINWRWRERDTSANDPAHTESPESPPPADSGERNAPVSDPHEWERRAHEEADAARLGRSGAPAQAGPGTGAGGGEAPRVGGS